jgi:uncharacterized membrane protein
MSKCIKCGTNVEAGMKYCKACGNELSKAELSFHDKKSRVLNKERTWVKPLAFTAIVIVLVLGGWFFKDIRAKSMGANKMFAPNRDASARTTSATVVNAQDGLIRIPIGAADDGNAHFFAYSAGGKTITFFVMKAADGSIRTAFDACTACNHAKLGYRQEGSMVVCNNCGMGFAPGDIGKQSGGCNPIPIEKSTETGMIVVKAKDIETGAQYF